MSKNIYVGNLPFSFTEDELHKLFEGEGKITKTHLITDHYSGQSKGFGFVEMENDDEAAKAIEKLNNQEVNGRRMIVNEARPKAQRPVGAGGGGKKNFKRW